MCVVKQYHNNYFFVKVNIFIKFYFFLLEQWYNKCIYNNTEIQDKK